MSVTVGTSVSVSMAVVGISLFLLVLNDIIRRCKSHLLCALHTLAACDLCDLDFYELLCGVASEFDFIGSKFGLTKLSAAIMRRALMDCCGGPPRDICGAAHE